MENVEKFTRDIINDAYNYDQESQLKTAKHENLVIPKEVFLKISFAYVTW